MDGERGVGGRSLVALMVKNLPANAADVGAVGFIPWWGRSLGVGNGNSLQYSCLENSIDRGTWRTTVHGVTKESDMTERVDMYIYRNVCVCVCIYICVCVCV